MLPSSRNLSDLTRLVVRTVQFGPAKAFFPSLCCIDRGEEHFTVGCRSGLLERTMEYDPISPISGYPNCTKYPNRLCHIPVQHLTQTVPRSRRSPSLLPPTRNSIPEIASRGWATSESRRGSSAQLRKRTKRTRSLNGMMTVV